MCEHRTTDYIQAPFIIRNTVITLKERARSVPGLKRGADSSGSPDGKMEKSSFSSIIIHHRKESEREDALLPRQR